MIKMAKTLPRTDVASFTAEDLAFAGKKERRDATVKGRRAENRKGNSTLEGNLASAKQFGKRAKRKKAGSEGTKKPKASTKKDASWRQNTRSRRLVANARERSRIHILSDAFENLRRAVPSYSQDQKLSKLAILKLATYYISALANLAESDTSARSLKQFADCVSHCTKALQTEGRARRKQF